LTLIVNLVAYSRAGTCLQTIKTSSHALRANYKNPFDLLLSLLASSLPAALLLLLFLSCVIPSARALFLIDIYIFRSYNSASNLNLMVPLTKTLKHITFSI